MKTRLEHANLQVQDVDAMVNFLQTAFPDFSIRYDSGRDDEERWLHIGNEDSYLALNKSTQNNAQPWEPYSGRPGLNHLGFEVEDVADLRERMLAAGYRESTVTNQHPARKRIYFHDPEGNDWEFVQYLENDRSRRNDYTDAE